MDALRVENLPVFDPKLVLSHTSMMPVKAARTSQMMLTDIFNESYDGT